MFVNGDKRGVKRAFQMPNILRKRAPPQPPAPAPPPPPPETQPTRQRVAKPTSRIHLDSYVCQNSNEKKPDSTEPLPSDTPLLLQIELVAQNYPLSKDGKVLVPVTLLQENFIPTKPVNETEKPLQCGHSEYHCECKECGAMFTSLDKLQQHTRTHARPLRPKKEPRQAPAPGQVKFCCPVKSQGEAPSCDVIYQSREDVMRHIKENHTEDDAPYRCESCGRGFFWYSGLRAHGRVHDASARSLYACLWPGCSRVFSQACRLKEHARSHTGDKPYPCLYPNCGWAFRTKSKLHRHERRHTGERRFGCGSCGAGFLRADHLREHQRRHSNPAVLHCLHPGCTHKFSSKSSLCMHNRRMHSAPDPPPPPPASPPPLALGADTLPHIDYLDLMDDWSSKSARTHVVWPFSRSAHPDTSASDDERDARTVYSKSDLLIHGDSRLLDNSEACLEVARELSLESDTRHLDSELTLLDSNDALHHLLQEELLLSDATDESAFPVLLLSGAEC